MYCIRCGKELSAQEQYCRSCGAPVGGGLSAENRMAAHLYPVAVLWIVISALRLLAALGVFVAAHFVLERIRIEAPPMPMPLDRFIGPMISLVGLGIAVFAVAGLAAGWGLLQRASWARILAIVLAVISLPEIPVGTALGIYTMWVLLTPGADQEYQRLSTPA